MLISSTFAGRNTLVITISFDGTNFQNVWSSTEFPSCFLSMSDMRVEDAWSLDCGRPSGSRSSFRSTLSSEKMNSTTRHRSSFATEGLSWNEILHDSEYFCPSIDSRRTSRESRPEKPIGRSPSPSGHAVGWLRRGTWGEYDHPQPPFPLNQSALAIIRSW